MASRWVGRAVLVLVGLGCGSPAVGGECICEFITSIGRDFERRNCWPHPFVASDRQAVREPFCIMVSNGWQLQNMISGRHLDVPAGQLTEAGKQRVLWIMNEAPEQHRVVYVHRGANPQETAARIAIVQQFVVQSAYGPDSLPSVLETSRSDDGTPADRVDVIGRRFQAATPDPKLPPREQSGSGSK